MVDGNQYFNRPGPRIAESLEILAEGLHPWASRFGHAGGAAGSGLIVLARPQGFG